jgi:hypothetical protein
MRLKKQDSEWVQMAQDRFQLRAILNTVMELLNFHVFQARSKVYGASG